MINKQKFVKNLIFVSIILLFLFGKRFARMEVSFFPGYILDLILIILIFLALPTNTKLLSKKLILKDYGIFIIGFLFLIYYVITSEVKNINELGQDSILVLYPLIFYFILKNYSLNINVQNYILKSLIFLYSNLLIIDFIFERNMIFTRILGFEINDSMLPNFNLVSLRPTETIFFLSIIVFLDVKSNNMKYNFIYIPVGIYFALSMTDSKTVMYGAIIFFLVLFIENENKFILQKLFFIGLGTIISLSSFSTTKNATIMTNQIKSMENIEIDSDAGLNRIRIISPECFLENLLIFRSNDCEFTIGFISFEFDLMIESYNQGFLSPSLDYLYSELENIHLNYLDGSNLSNINDLNTSRPFQELYKNCVEKNLVNINGKNCQEISKKYDGLIILKNSTYKELCGNNINWRLNLWKKSINSNGDGIAGVIFGNGIGYSIPQKLVETDKLPVQCYFDSLSKNNPLRNSHNSFVTFFHRFGLINFLILSFYLFISVRNFFTIRKSSIIILPLIFTFFDPILDGPVSLFPFLFLIFYLQRNKIEYAIK
tara:strand:+ start:7348 stop:8976 length:1629 start_codon:yes stop_codon:yes gene_type:complete